MSEIISIFADEQESTLKALIIHFYKELSE